MINAIQIKKIHASLPAAIKNDKELKEDLICQFTGDYNKCSTKDLTQEQANALIKFLAKDSGAAVVDDWAKFDYKNKKHKYILSLCHQIGWVVYNSNLQKNTADLATFGNWLRKYGYKHKPLMQYNEVELSILVSQIEKIKL